MADEKDKPVAALKNRLKELQKKTDKTPAELEEEAALQAQAAMWGT